MKYTADELQAMAQQVLQAQQRGDARAELLVLVLSANQRLPPQDVQARIEALARGEGA